MTIAARLAGRKPKCSTGSMQRRPSIAKAEIAFPLVVCEGKNQNPKDAKPSCDFLRLPKPTGALTSVWRILCAALDLRTGLGLCDARTGACERSDEFQWRYSAG